MNLLYTKFKTWVQVEISQDPVIFFSSVGNKRDRNMYGKICTTIPQSLSFANNYHVEIHFDLAFPRIFEIMLFETISKQLRILHDRISSNNLQGWLGLTGSTF